MKTPSKRGMADQTQVEDDLKADKDAGFEPFIPKLVQTSKFGSDDTSKIACEGCGLEFVAKQQKNRRSKLICSVDYYQHCLLKCRKYRHLGRHTRCFKCMKLFMKQSNYDYHLRSYPDCQRYHNKQEKIISDSTTEESERDSGTEIDDTAASPLTTSVNSSMSTFPVASHGTVKEPSPEVVVNRMGDVTRITMPCPGFCGRMFRCNMKSPHDPESQNIIGNAVSPEMIAHVVQCPLYFDLGIVTVSCAKCRISFPDEQSFDFHKKEVCPFLL